MKANKSTIIKVAVAVVLAVVVFFVIRYAAKKFKESAGDRKAARNLAAQAAEFEKAGLAPAQLTSSQCMSIAERVYDSMHWYNDDEEKARDAILSIPTAADYFGVKSAFQSEYGKDMFAYIDDYMSGDKEFIEMKAHLTKIGLPESAW